MSALVVVGVVVLVVVAVLREVDRDGLDDEARRGQQRGWAADRRRRRRRPRRRHGLDVRKFVVALSALAVNYQRQSRLYQSRGGGGGSSGR
jgi:hypothetical protein